MILTTFILLAIAAFCKAQMDYIVFRKQDNSWKNKWLLDDSGKLIPATKRPWYYLGLYLPKYEERFPYSSTCLVFLADAWHRYQFIMLRSFYSAISISLFSELLWRIAFSFLFFPVVFSLVFITFYNKQKKV